MRSYDHHPKESKSKKLYWIIAILIFFGAVFAVSTAIAYKFYATSRKVIENSPPSSFLGSIKDIAAPSLSPLRGEEEGRINILLVGLAGENYPGENLTDSIMIASVNPKTYQTALLSVPRDLYVNIPGTNSYTKINALYARGHDVRGRSSDGVEDLKKALSEITGLDIHYYIALDFDGFKQVIDELGGIKIQVPKDIHDERYPGPNYSYQTFDIKQGLYIFDGETALKYARTRHDEDGDFGRSYRQQQILEAARTKAFSLGTAFNIPGINDVLNTLGDHLRTDIQLDEMNSFLELMRKIDTHTTVNYVFDAGKPASVMAVSHVFLGGVRAFTLIPRTGDYDETRDIAANIFDLDLINRKKEAVKAENTYVAVVNESGVSGFDSKLIRLLDKMNYRVNVGFNKYSLAAPQETSDTTIYDLTNGLKPFSLEDLSKKLSAKISTSLPASLSGQCKDSDFCLVAGSDIADKLNYEENSVSDLEQGYDQQQIDEKGYVDLLKKGSNKKF